MSTDKTARPLCANQGRDTQKCGSSATPGHIYCTSCRTNIVNLGYLRVRGKGTK